MNWRLFSVCRDSLTRIGFSQSPISGTAVECSTQWLFRGALGSASNAHCTNSLGDLQEHILQRFRPRGQLGYRITRMDQVLSNPHCAASIACELGPDQFPSTMTW